MRIKPERKHSKGKQFLRWPAIGLLGLVAGGFLGLNYLAEQQEKEIKQDLAEWVQQFPKTEANDSALKLRALIAKLGIGIEGYRYFLIDAYTLSHPDFIPSETEKKAFEDIRKELEKYLDEQLAKPNDEIDGPPENLRQYLESQAAVIEAIKNHVRDNEVPRWETDVTYILDGNIDWGFPSDLDLVALQRILALDIIEKQRQGQTRAALEMLEVSWKINQSIRDRPNIIEQVLALQAGRYPTGVMRKLENIPAEWQERLREHDYRKSLFLSVEGVFFAIFNASKVSIEKLINLHGMEVSQFGKILDNLRPLSQPYIRFKIMTYLTMGRQATTKMYEENICSAYSVKINEEIALWDRLHLGYRNNVPYLVDREGAAAHYMLELELNQKILQIKEMAAKTGEWPKYFPDMESLICPGFQWVYQVSPDGTMSISLSDRRWWGGIYGNRLPLIYSDRTPPPKKARPVGQ